MCGRYSFVPTKKQVETELDDVHVPAQLEISYNIAPTQAAYVLSDANPKTLSQMRWGLLPFWAKEDRPNGKLINARSETVAEKPAFRNAFAERRCLVPADSFYEWRKEGKNRRPFRILAQDGGLLFFAGIYEKKGEDLLTFSILTTSPNREMQGVHDRMPVLFQEKEKRDAWLSEDLPKEEALDLLNPLPDGALRLYEVHKGVGNVRNNGADLHLPVLTLGL